MTPRIPTALLALTLGFVGIGTAQASLGNTVTGTAASAVPGNAQAISSAGSITASVGTSATVNLSNSKHNQDSGDSVKEHGDASSVTGAVNASADTSGNDKEHTLSADKGKADKLESFSVSRGELQVSGAHANRNGSVNANTATDFKSTVVSAMHDDANIKNVSADDAKGLLLQYQEPARILGLIPSHIVATVQVTSDDTVIVHYPWYGFLMSGKRSAADLMDSLTTILVTSASGSATAQTNSAAAQGNGSGSATVNAESWAQRLERVLAILRGRVSATSSTSASAGTSY